MQTCLRNQAHIPPTVEHAEDSSFDYEPFPSGMEKHAVFATTRCTSVLTAGTTGAGRPYFVMQLVKGISHEDGPKV